MKYVFIKNLAAYFIKINFYNSLQLAIVTWKVQLTKSVISKVDVVIAKLESLENSVNSVHQENTSFLNVKVQKFHYKYTMFPILTFKVSDE